MPTYTIRPNADWTGASAFTRTGGTTNWGNLSDNTDATFLTKTGTSTVAGIYEMEFATSTIPATEKITKVNVRVRARRVTSAPTGQVLSIALGYITDRNSKTTKFSATSVITPSSTIATIDTGINATAAPDGTSWVQAKIDDLVVRLYDTTETTYNANIYEVYVDVTTTTQPTVTVTAPTGTISTTSFPAVNWTYADTEGDPQIAYRVKIFDAATYGGGSFNPDTSQVTVDTGEVQSSDAGASLTVDLANTTTYRAYVKVAQDVNGSYYWSNWSFSGFSLAVNAPGVPTIGAAYETATTAVNIELIGRTNQLSANAAGIETSAAGWTADNNCTLTRSTAQSAEGGASLLLSSAASGDMSARTATAYNVVNNQNYSAIASVRTVSSARSARIGIRWRDSGGTTISTTYGTAVTDSSSVWTTMNVTGTSPTNAATAYVIVQIQSAVGVSEGHYVDKIAFLGGSTPEYTVGGFSNFAFDVEKTIDGSTWSAVRGSPITADIYQNAQIYDYEIPVGLTQYRAKARGDI